MQIPNDPTSSGLAIRIARFWETIEALPQDWAKSVKVRSDSSAGQGSVFFSAAISALQTLHEELFLTIGPQQARPEFIISANGNPALFPLVMRIVDATPQSVREHLDVRALRPAQGFGSIVRLGDLVLDANNVRYISYPGHERLDVRFFIPGFTHLQDETGDQLAGALFLLLDHAIGEHSVATILGKMDFSPAEEAPPESLPLPALGEEVDRFAAHSRVVVPPFA